MKKEGHEAGCNVMLEKIAGEDCDFAKLESTDKLDGKGHVKSHTRLYLLENTAAFLYKLCKSTFDLMFIKGEPTVLELYVRGIFVKKYVELIWYVFKFGTSWKLWVENILI